MSKRIYKELIKFAIMAPSGHNTQPWKFVLHENEILIHPDYSRMLPVVDTDNHALWISLGCALENLVIAATNFNKKSEVSIHVENESLKFIRVKLTPSSTTDRDDLFDYIEKRQSTRSKYSGKKIPEQDLKILRNSFDFQGVSARLFGQNEFQLLEPFIIEGSNRQFRNNKFVTELIQWCRFSGKEAKGKRDGLWTESMGLPNVGRFIGTIIMKHFISPESEAKRWRKLIYSSSGFALFIADKNDITHWVNLGRAFQRFALIATKLNMSHAHVNMPCEEIEVRKKMADRLELSGKHPLLLIRFGYSNKMPYSFRRPADEVVTP